MTNKEEIVWKTIFIVIIVLLGVLMIYSLTPSQEEYDQKNLYRDCLKDFAKDYCESNGMNFEEDKKIYPFDSTWDFKCAPEREYLNREKQPKFKFLDEEFEECKELRGYER